MKPLLSLVALVIITLSAAAQVGIGTTTPHHSAQLDVTSTTRGFLPPRMDSNQRNAIVSPQAGLTIYNTSLRAFQCFNGTAWYSTVHYIGEHYGGGIVFFVYDNGQHGLIAAVPDQGYDYTAPWYAGSYTNTVAYGGQNVGISGMGIGAGRNNTVLIIASQGLGNTNRYAARLCNEWIGTGDISFEDWYLPSIEELYLLFLQQSVVGGFELAYYWSSTEYTSNQAWSINFFGGLERVDDKALPAYVRPIRSF